MSLLYTDSLLLRIYDEDCIRKVLHLLDTAKVLLKLLPLFLQLDNFLLRQYLKSTVLRHGLDLFQSCDTALDSLEVGHHTAQPSLVYIEHTATLSLGTDCVLSLLLGTNEQDGATVCSNIKYSIVSLVYFANRLLKINDVDTISLGVDVRSHFRVPSSCLMSEMNTSFQ